MSKYKVGDIVKLRDDLEDDKIYGGVKYIKSMEHLKKLPISIEECIKDCFCERYWINVNFEKWAITDEMIEGLWEECKSTEQVSKSEGKYKLIDVLNKIANGELKEGTKVKIDNMEYTKLILDTDEKIDSSMLNKECELIEPNDFPDVGKMAEPTDNTKIEELKGNGRNGNFYTIHDWIATIEDKLNEVIRYINKGAEE